MARPSSFTQAKADLICTRLADGESLRSICSTEGMPDRVTVFRWLRERDEFRIQYARAREDQAESIAEEMMEIADDGRRDYTEDEEGRLAVDHDHIQRSKLRVETRKWLLAKMAPRKYGDRLQLANDPDNPIGTLTDEQIEERIARLQEKGNG